MKQTNNAIKFLMAQYRAIFKNANIAMAAAIAAAALAAGQAQAADFTNNDLEGATGELTFVGASATGKPQYDNLTLSGSASAVPVVPEVTFILQSGGGHTLKGNNGANKGTLDLSAATIKVEADGKVNDVNNNKLTIGEDGKPTAVKLGTLSIKKGTVELSGAASTDNKNSLTITNDVIVGDDSAKAGDAALLVKQNANVTTSGNLEIKKGAAVTVGVSAVLKGNNINIGTEDISFAINGTAGAGVATIEAANELNISGGTFKTTSANNGLLKADTINFGNATITNTSGDVGFDAATVNISSGTFTNTDGNIKVEGTDVNVSGGTFTNTKGTITFGKSGSTVDVNGATIDIAAAQDNKVILAGATNTIGADTTINYQGSGSIVVKGNTTFDVAAGKLTSNANGKLVIEDATATMSAELLKKFLTGKVGSADSKTAVIHLTDKTVDLAGGNAILSGDGTLNGNYEANSGFFQFEGTKATFSGAADVNAAATFKFEELELGKAGALNIKGGAQVQAGKLLTVTKGDGAGINVASGSLILDGTSGSVSAKAIVLNDNDAELLVNNGSWTVPTLTLTNGNGTVTGSDLNVSGDLTVTKGALSLTDGASLKVTGNLSTVGSAGKITANKSVIDTVGGGTVTLGAATAAGLELKNTSEIKLEAADFQKNSAFDASLLKGAIVGDSNTTISFVDAEGQKLTLSKADFDKLEQSVGDGFKGLFNVNVTGITNAQDGMALGDVSNNAAIEAYEKVSVKQDSATAVDNTNKSVGSVEVTGGNTLNMGTDTSLTLNNAKDGKLVYEVKDGVAQTGNVVFKNAGNSLTLAGSGEIGSIKVDSTVGANGGNVTVGKATKTAAVTVKGDIGAEAANSRVLGVTVNDKSSLTVNNVYTTALELGLGSSLNAGTGVVDVSGASSIEGNVKAGTLKLGGESFIAGDAFVDVGTINLGANALTIGKDGDAEGNGSSSASVFADTLMMTNGSKVFVDPSYKKNASIFVTEEIKAGTNPDDIGVLDGGLFVGKNAAFGYGFDQAEFESVIADYMVGGKFVDPDVDGATGRANALALNKPLTVKANGGIVVKHTLTPDNLTTELKTDSLVLGKNAALVLTDGAFGEGKKSAAITFKANGTVTADDTSKVVLVGDFDANDTALKIAVQNAGTVATNADKLKVEYAGGLLTGTYDAAVNGFKLVFQQDKADAIYDGISRPVADAIVAKLQGQFKDKNAAGYGLLSNLIATQNYKAVDAAAHAATYAGAQQAAVAAVTTMADAMFGRVGAVGVEAASISATGSQANGGVWLTPMYKSVDSDGFNAEGASYGADVDLSGVAFGTDTVNGNMRFGAVFNIGSGDAEGKGNGNGLKDEFDYYGFGIYSAMGFGNFALVGDASMTVISHEVEGLGLRGKADTTAVTMGVTGQYTVATPVVDVTPHLGARFIRLNTDSYDLISANGVEGTTDFDVQNVFSVPLGVTLSKAFVAGGWSLAPSADLTIAFNTGDTEAKSNTFIAGKNIGLNTEVLDEVQYGVTLGLGAQYGAFGTSFGINYTGSENTDSFGVNAQARYMF